MPNVPNVPGVPALDSYSPNVFALALVDTVAAVGTFFGPAWGIYMDGSPVITPASIVPQGLVSALGAISAIASLIGLPNVVPCVASTIEFDYTADSPISNYPQEAGAFQSYNKVQLPFDLRIKLACGGGVAQRQAFFGTLEALRTSVALVDVVTPEKIYVGVNCKHVDFRRTADRGVDLVIADVWFEQVNEISSTTFSNTKSPGDAGAQSIGNVQPQTPSDGISQQFAGIGGSPY